MKINTIIYSIICIFLMCACSMKNKESEEASLQDMSVQDAEYVLQYYKTTLSFTNEFVRMSDIDSVLYNLDEGRKEKSLPYLSAPVLNSSDTTYLTNPLAPFSNEVKSNLISNYRNLFKSVNALFENYNTYRLYMNDKKYLDDNGALADKIRNEELMLGISIPELQSVIYDILTPWVNHANKALKSSSK